MSINIPEKSIKDYSSIVIPEISLEDGYKLFTEMKNYYYKVLHLSVQCDFDSNFNCIFELNNEEIDMFYLYDEYMEAGFRELLDEYGSTYVVKNLHLEAPIKF